MAIGAKRKLKREVAGLSLFQRRYPCSTLSVEYPRARVRHPPTLRPQDYESRLRIGATSPPRPEASSGASVPSGMKPMEHSVPKVVTAMVTKSVERKVGFALPDSGRVALPDSPRVSVGTLENAAPPASWPRQRCGRTEVNRRTHHAVRHIRIPRKLKGPNQTARVRLRLERSSNQRPADCYSRSIERWRSSPAPNPPPVLPRGPAHRRGITWNNT